MHKLTAVVPIRLGEDFMADSGSQMTILFRSLERFCEAGMFAKILVVCPGGDVKQLRAAMRKWQKHPIEVLDESSMSTDFSARKTTPGWAIQQMVKMAACRIIETDFYLTLDADCFCIRPTRLGDLVRNGKGLIQLESKTWQAAWWKESARVLGHRLDMSRPGMSVTPAVLSTKAMSDLLRTLNERHVRWDSYLQSYYRLSHFNTLKQFVSPAVWTEYTLYFSFLEMTESVWNFHFDSATSSKGEEERTLISKNSCWQVGDFQKWQAASVFEGNDTATFAVIQSRLRPSVDEILEKVRGYI